MDELCISCERCTTSTVKKKGLAKNKILTMRDSNVNFKFNFLGKLEATYFFKSWIDCTNQRPRWVMNK
jgi:hypothetical protein